MQTCGEKIRAVRLSKGLTLRQLEQLTGIHNSYLSQVERDKRSIRLEMARVLADALGVSLDWLAGRPLRTRRTRRTPSGRIEDCTIRGGMIGRNP